MDAEDIINKLETMAICNTIQRFIRDQLGTLRLESKRDACQRLVTMLLYDYRQIDMP